MYVCSTVHGYISLHKGSANGYILTVYAIKGDINGIICRMFGCSKLRISATGDIYCILAINIRTDTYLFLYTDDIRHFTKFHIKRSIRDYSKFTKIHNLFFFSFHILYFIYMRQKLINK
jgi:hypothetical protein